MKVKNKMLLIEHVGHIGLRSLADAILDAILNISKRSMKPEWHQLDSSSTMPQQQESTKKKTLKSSSRSLSFSNGLLYNFEVLSVHFGE